MNAVESMVWAFLECCNAGFPHLRPQRWMPSRHVKFRHMPNHHRTNAGVVSKTSVRGRNWHHFRLCESDFVWPCQWILTISWPRFTFKIWFIFSWHCQVNEGFGAVCPFLARQSNAAECRALPVMCRVLVRLAFRHCHCRTRFQSSPLTFLSFPHTVNSDMDI